MSGNSPYEVVPNGGGLFEQEDQQLIEYQLLLEELGLGQVPGQPPAYTFNPPPITPPTAPGAVQPFLDGTGNLPAPPVPPLRDTGGVLPRLEQGMAINQGARLLADQLYGQNVESISPRDFGREPGYYQTGQTPEGLDPNYTDGMYRILADRTNELLTEGNEARVDELATNRNSAIGAYLSEVSDRTLPTYNALAERAAQDAQNRPEVLIPNSEIYAPLLTLAEDLANDRTTAQEYAAAAEQVIAQELGPRGTRVSPMTSQSMAMSIGQAQMLDQDKINGIAQSSIDPQNRVAQIHNAFMGNYSHIQDQIGGFNAKATQKLLTDGLAQQYSQQRAELAVLATQTKSAQRDQLEASVQERDALSREFVDKWRNSAASGNTIDRFIANQALGWTAGQIDHWGMMEVMVQEFITEEEGNEFVDPRFSLDNPGVEDDDYDYIMDRLKDMLNLDRFGNPRYSDSGQPLTVDLSSPAFEGNVIAEMAQFDYLGFETGQYDDEEGAAKGKGLALRNVTGVDGKPVFIDPDIIRYFRENEGQLPGPRPDARPLPNN